MLSGSVVESDLYCDSVSYAMSDHVAALSWSCFYVWQLRLIKQSLTPEATKTLVHALVSSRLDYCNSELTGLSGHLLRNLQVIQNAAARPITGARRSGQMMPVLRDLHWLLVRQQITFKTAILIFKCLHDMAAQYLQTYCKPLSACTDRHHLRSVQSGLLTVPRTLTNFGDRSFVVHGPCAWNSLPAELHSLDTLDTFRHKLFCSLSNCWLSTFVALCDLVLYKKFLIITEDLAIKNNNNNNNYH